MYLELMELDATFEKTNRSKTNDIFHDEERNNVLVFLPHENGCTEEVIEYTIDDAYNYLIGRLNTDRGLVVIWSQEEGTSSDYIILNDIDINNLNLMSHKKTMEELNDIITDADCSSNATQYKYTELVDEYISRIRF